MFYFVQREENKNTLAKLGISVDDLTACILSLSCSDFHKGPENDRDGSKGEVWVFRHPIDGCSIYIKLKLFQKAEQDYVNIISFHD